MKRKQIPWGAVAVLVAELVLVAAAVTFPLVITSDVLNGLLRILELAAKIT